MSSVKSLFIIIGIVSVITLFAAGCAGSDTRVIDTEAAANIDSTLQNFVDSGTLAGISALIYEKGEEVYFNAYGMADRENDVPMSRNTIVQVYSMTKPITGAALMKLYEEGAFRLDDPVSLYIPEFSGLKVYTGVDADGNLILEPPRREMTVRDLTRHTAGFVAGDEVPVLQRLNREADPMNMNNTLTQMAERLGSVPLWFHPGDKWSYGISVDVQALLVERLSGKPFDVYLRESILDPLGMNETRYYIPENDRERFAAMYYRDSEEGTLTRVPDERGRALNTREFTLKPGGYGLSSTIDDYMKFARMLVQEGELDGVRVLRPETVRLMAANHLSDDVTDRSWLPSKGQVGFGINFAVRLRPPVSDEENFGVTGEFFWDGAASTLFWVDPVNELTAVLYVQLMPYDQVGLHRSFRKAVYSRIN